MMKIPCLTMNLLTQKKIKKMMIWTCLPMPKTMMMTYLLRNRSSNKKLLMICLGMLVFNRHLFSNSSRVNKKMTMMILGNSMKLNHNKQNPKRYNPSRQNRQDNLQEKKHLRNQVILIIQITYLILLHLKKLLREINRRSSNLSRIIIHLICSSHRRLVVTNITLLIRINKIRVFIN